MAYTPIQSDKLYYYGELPGTSGETITYDISLSNISDKVAKEVLVYLWATTKGDDTFHRYYYLIETKDSAGLTYHQYMNAAASPDVSLNSANLWLPVFDGFGQVKVTLVNAQEPTAKGKCIAHKFCKGGKTGQENTFSQFFVLGYR